ncbi:MAG: hypothetical protein MUC77_07630 [Chromatiaceae bacterium]|jgi:CheY-like chemotaxis protein|nr:hypothetical protein [Chromatiaceae bacterium]
MPANPPPRFFRILLIEDDIERVQSVRTWLPPWARVVWAQSAGGALGLIRRDAGHVYGGVMLDHDLGQRAMTADDAALSGSDVALALIAHFSPDIPILVQSTNQVQVPRVVRQLEEQGFWVTRRPWYEMTEAAFLAWIEEARALWEEL